MKIKAKNLKLPANKLLALYRDKPVTYGSLQGKIIHIAYYDNEPVPSAELELYTIDCRTVNKIIPLSEVVLIAGAA